MDLRVINCVISGKQQTNKYCGIYIQEFASEKSKEGNKEFQYPDSVHKQTNTETYNQEFCVSDKSKE